MTRVAITLFLALTLAGLAVSAGDEPNVSDDRDMEAMINEAGAGLAKVQETDDGPILWAMTVFYVPRLVGEANTEDWRRGSTFFLTLWSPKFDEAYAFMRVEGERVILGTAEDPDEDTPGHYNKKGEWVPFVGNFNTVGSNSANSIIFTDDGGVIGLMPDWMCLAVGNHNPGRSNSANSVIGFGNYNTSRNNAMAALAPYPIGEGPGGGELGERFVVPFLELDVVVLLEASCPWIPARYVEAVIDVVEGVRNGVLR